MAMNDNTPTETLVPESSLAETLPTAGELIRTTRQKMGLHLAVLSVNLKVPVRQLEALEADQHDPSKGPVFIRALASSVCRQLQMDPVPVLALLPQAPGQMQLRRESIAPMQSAPRLRLDIMTFLRGLPRQTLVIAALMLSSIAALLWMPSPSSWAWLESKPVATVAAPAPEVMPEASAAASPEIAGSSAEPAPVVQEAVVVAAAAPAAGVTPLPLPVASLPAMAATPVNTPSVSTGAMLGFVARQESWIEIRNDKNQVLWSRVMREGETTQVQFPLPLRVVIGRANAVNVTYQGKAFDLAPHTKVTVARFEVKE
jgi:cytoskeleton protein RodZ